MHAQTTLGTATQAPTSRLNANARSLLYLRKRAARFWRTIVVDPWPASRAIEKALRTDRTLRLVREDVHLDRGRSLRRQHLRVPMTGVRMLL